MGTKQNAAYLDSFTATANELRLTSGNARVALASCHLLEAERDLYQALDHAWRAGDYDRYDRIGKCYLEVKATTERLRGLSL